MIRSYLPPLQTPVSHGDRAAQKGALAVFGTPELRSFPIHTFIGRLVCEADSAGGSTSSENLVQLVWKKATRFIQQNGFALSTHVPRLQDCSFQELDEMGQSIESRIDALLTQSFSPVFEKLRRERPDVLEEFGLGGIEPERIGARIRNWMHRRVPRRPMHPPFEIYGRSIDNLQNLQFYLLGMAVYFAVRDGQNALALWILRDAVGLDAQMLGFAFRKGVKNNNLLILTKIVESGRAINTKLLVESWEIATSNRAERICCLIEKCISKERIIGVILCNAIFRNDERTALALVAHEVWERVGDLDLLMDARNYAKRLNLHRLKGVIQDRIWNLTIGAEPDGLGSG